MRLIGKLKDRPSLVTYLIIIVVGLQAVLVKFGVPNVLLPLQGADDVNDLYLAMLSVAALQASFAGVVVVFGLSTQPQAFRNLRVKAGSALVDNWMSISYSGFLSAGCALIAALANMMKYGQLAPWFFEVSVLFCVHGVVRLLWLLKQLIKVVRDVDSKEAQKESERR